MRLVEIVKMRLVEIVTRVVKIVKMRTVQKKYYIVSVKSCAM